MNPALKPKPTQLEIESTKLALTLSRISRSKTKGKKVEVFRLGPLVNGRTA